MSTAARPQRIGILAGAFNPVTRAHLALVDAALERVDKVICVVPRKYPHKEFHGADLETRIKMLERAAEGRRLQVAVCEHGLFIDIARDLRPYHPGSEFYFICGRDAAERAIHWDYGDPLAINLILREFRLLVAARQGEFSAPDHLRDRVETLALGSDCDGVSSTEVRERIAARRAWQHLVPESIVEMVERIYRAS